MMKCMKNPTRLSHAVLVVLIVITVIVFAAFWLVGFNMPFMDDPRFNAPLLTDVVIAFVYLMLLLAIMAVVLNMSGWARRFFK